MHSSFALDLKAARRKSGLSQRDCGHLLGIDQRRVSRLESGKTLPSIHEICGLSLIYGRSFESLFGPVFADIRSDIRARLATLPHQKLGWLARFNRRHTLTQIGERVEDNHIYRG